MSAVPNLPFDHDSMPSDEGQTMRQIVLVKRGERFVFRYAPGQESKLLIDLSEMANDPTCDLDWFDAAVLSHQMGKRFSQELKETLKSR